MKKVCKAFGMEDPREAYDHIEKNLAFVRNYGDRAYGHWLHTWDDGFRSLLRCRKCGAYILYQSSEFHGMMSGDSYYGDYFPVGGKKKADKLNRRYDGDRIEQEFPKRYLMKTNGSLAWNRGKDAKKGT